MNDRKILAYHHQFDSRRLDGLARLYSVVDHLRYEVRGCTTGFAYTEYPGSLVDFFLEETRRPHPKHRPISLAQRRQPPHPSMHSRCCVTVDFSDGWVRRLGFPIYRLNKLWFPELSARLLTGDIYEHLAPLERRKLAA